MDKKIAEAGVILSLLIQKFPTDLLESIAFDLWQLNNSSADKKKKWEKALEVAIDTAAKKSYSNGSFTSSLFDATLRAATRSKYIYHPVVCRQSNLCGFLEKR
jgi:hypothetical protein